MKSLSVDRRNSTLCYEGNEVALHHIIGLNMYLPEIAIFLEPYHNAWLNFPANVMKLTCSVCVSHHSLTHTTHTKLPIHLSAPFPLQGPLVIYALSDSGVSYRLVNICLLLASVVVGRRGRNVVAANRHRHTHIRPGSLQCTHTTLTVSHIWISGCRIKDMKTAEPQKSMHIHLWMLMHVLSQPHRVHQSTRHMPGMCRTFTHKK
jgi:hypothetical protein